MASASRSLRLASRFTAVPRPFALRTATASVSQRAAFTVSARRFKSEVVRETEVPVTVYNPDSKGAPGSSPEHFTIPAQPSRPVEPVVEEVDEVQPLSDEVYAQMPRTLQKMSVKGKVIIITG
jgi:hypothetical protein